MGEAWRCVWANDIDPKKAVVYIHNFGSDELTVCDVAEIDPLSLSLKVDMAWASFPCQDLSLAGWRRGMSAERSGTFWAFWRIMRDLYDRGDMPPIIVLENVMGLLYDEDFPGLCEALAALDLQFGALVIDAKHFLPQSRQRVFIIGVKADINVKSFLTKTTEGSPWIPKALLSAHAKLSPSLYRLWRWWKLPTPSFPVPSLADIIEEDPSSVDWNTPEETQRLLEMMTPPNRQKIEKAFLSGSRMVGTLYKRTRNGVQRAEVRFDGIAGCLRTPQGGASRQTILIVDKREVKSRLLSPREAARLMGAPDTFWLPDKYNDAYRAMGDAVAVPVVSWLSRHLLTPLALTVRTASKKQSPKKDNDRSIRYRLTAERLASKWRSMQQ